MNAKNPATSSKKPSASLGKKPLEEVSRSSNSNNSADKANIQRQMPKQGQQQQQKSCAKDVRAIMVKEKNTRNHGGDEQEQDEVADFKL
jgi:hypothetical protein